MRYELSNKIPFWARIGIGVALALITAVLFTVSFPPYTAWPCIFAAAVPFLVAQYRVLANETQTGLVIGYDLETPEDFRNEATVLSPNGDFPGIYDKVHPTVFGGEPYGINAGTFPVYETPLGTLGTLICFDMDFTDAARKLAIQGAEFIAVPSLDFPDIAKVHYTQMALRAVENRTAMVTAVVDPNGRLIDWRVVPNGGEAILVADVPLGTGPTLYTRLGDWVGWLSLAGPALLIVPTPIIRQNAE